MDSITFGDDNENEKAHLSFMNTVIELAKKQLALTEWVHANPNSNNAEFAIKSVPVYALVVKAVTERDRYADKR
mgnify:CR=1 FL=1